MCFFFAFYGNNLTNPEVLTHFSRKKPQKIALASSI